MLDNRTIALPESRQLDILAALLESRGGRVRRVPLVAIHDAPDPRPVLRWLREFIAEPGDELVLLTGEGLRRLLALAEREGLAEAFREALARVRVISRGPKPQRVLREAGIKESVLAAEPTSAGVIQTLGELGVAGHLVSVQLYGEEPNEALCGFIRGQGARLRAVAPYIYASEAEESQVLGLIDDLAAGTVDAIAFTSQPQYRRLAQVAGRHGREEALRQGLERCVVAVVGPVVKEQLEGAGVRVDLMPERAWFMKPLVTELVKHFQARDGDGGSG